MALRHTSRLRSRLAAMSDQLSAMIEAGLFDACDADTRESMAELVDALLAAADDAIPDD
jgi:hypothetical protein